MDGNRTTELGRKELRDERHLRRPTGQQHRIEVLPNDTGGSQRPAQRLDGLGYLRDQVLQLDLARPHL
ncbi:MAG: hypothetical protein ACRDSN_21945 [Pseudonocardiaceae bacterium]